MSITTVTQSSPANPTIDQSPRPRAMRRKIIGAVVGASAIGALALTAVGPGVDIGESSPTGRPGPKPAAVVQQPGWTEVHAGCLNDLECFGDASQRQAPSSVLPTATASD